MTSSVETAIQILNKTFGIELDENRMPTAEELVSKIKSGTVTWRTNAAFADLKVKVGQPASKNRSQLSVDQTIRTSFYNDKEAYELIKNLMSGIQVSQIKQDKRGDFSQNAIDMLKVEIKKQLGIIIRGNYDREGIKQKLMDTSEVNLLRHCC